MQTHWSEKPIVEILHMFHDSKTPTKARTTDVGYDVYARGTTILHPLTNTQVSTGVRIACANGYYMTLDGRSSLWSKGIICNRGIIDATYNGELLVSLFNSSRDEIYEVMPGDRIAQLIIHKQMEMDFRIVSEFSPAYNLRGESGFGSTGR